MDLLESRGCDVWYDHYVKSNIPYQQQLLENSFQREVFIALFGIGTANSDWVHREIDTDRAGDAAFIPVIIDEQFTVADLYTFYLER